MKCPFCQEEIMVEASKCNHCGNMIGSANTPVMSAQTVSGDLMFCRQCGSKNNNNNLKCISCGALLHNEGQKPAIQVDNTMGGMIPTGNPKALIAYYLGIFSLIGLLLPFFNLAIAIPAVILGKQGLNHAAKNPKAKGKAHAWTGIILGCLNILETIALLIVLILKNI